MNKQIRAWQVRVIGPDGQQIGIRPLQEALKRAEEMGLDLVEVAPTAVPPVCRIMDYGKYKYEQAKKQQQARQHQRAMQLKEVKFRLQISPHDLEIKIRNARRFLEENHKVKVTLVFRGREITYAEHGKELLEHFLEEVQDLARVERPPQLEGNQYTMILAPLPESQRRRKASKKGATHGEAETQDPSGSSQTV